MLQSISKTNNIEDIFSSKGNKRSELNLFSGINEVNLAKSPLKPIIQRVTTENIFSTNGKRDLLDIFEKHRTEAVTTRDMPADNTSAGKNTYTYDAHTYHTKVPPQGIVNYLRHYLPESGLILDPFAGSGMTGVASIVAGYDVILNELSPAACFIANQFTRNLEAEKFMLGMDAVLSATKVIREELYSTQCRECRKKTEIQYTVWSYEVECNHCNQPFILWDHCRKYGNSVKEHKILSEFECPHCSSLISKSRLKRRGTKPVLLGYKCCSKRQVEHPLDAADIDLINRIDANPPVLEGYFPANEIGNGVNLNQPKSHGLDSIDKFYTKRNLAALSHLWFHIHRIEDVEVAAAVAFVFTSLYQRVTKLSEYRFWGGSGNTARFNVPQIFNEANIFTTFVRKGKSIQDHLETTAQHYDGKSIVINGSATNLNQIPSDSIDLIFTDPPFGANINYSEMNILWESWLGRFTDSTSEAIINKAQNKTLDDYYDLMHLSLKECYRVLRPNHWMLLVFMNSSAQVWQALKKSIINAGFELRKVDIFDKKHGTFKHHVSENTAGYDLVLHCFKSDVSGNKNHLPEFEKETSIIEYLVGRGDDIPTVTYQHVNRVDGIDYRNLYSDWLVTKLVKGHEVVNFSEFRKVAIKFIAERIKS